MIKLYKDFLSYIIDLQQKINILVTDSFDKLDSGDLSMYAYILFVAFIYGLIHALGPGHGKMVIASYFLVHGSHAKEAIKAAFLTAGIHTLSALSITTVLYLFFQDTITEYFALINTNMYKLSAIFIIFIALFLFFETFKQRNKQESFSTKKNMNIFKIAVSIGIVPCPGVMSIVLFSMILGYFYLGVASAFSMSIGMGITMSFAAILSTKLKTSELSKRYHALFQKLSYLGILILFTLGIVILV